MAGEDVTLEGTPTYAVATSAALFIAISLLMERGIHRLKKYLKASNQRPLRKVLDKMTQELMLLGFVSLLLTVSQKGLSKICVSPDFSRHMLPCERKGEGSVEEAHFLISSSTRHLLATGASSCAQKGKVAFISLEGLHQLHLFIFVLAVVHVTYSCLIVGLGFARVHHWQKWERETRCANYNGQLDLKKRYCDKAMCKRNSDSFVDRYASHPFSESALVVWMLCFFRQFAGYVSREDYLTFRVGFLNNHNLGDSFNFRDYVIRSMEVDFKKVIGISWWLWGFVVLFLLLNVHGWYTYFWAAFIPTILVLVIGTKQQHIIATLARQAKYEALKSLEDVELAQGQEGKEEMRQEEMMKAGIKPSDKLFWFDEPKLLLKLLHFVIFQNSFELAVFLWLWATFGWHTCFFGKTHFLLIRIFVGIFTQLLSSYSTLPIYALVTQMGSGMKETVFTKTVYEGLVGWRARARKRSQSAPASSPGSSHGSDANGDAKDDDDDGRAAESAPQSCIVKQCQRLYGTSGGLQKVRAAQVVTK